jgi:tetratricopeptide (TPR) repeat protein
VSDFLTVFRELAARLLGPSSLAEETAALRTTSFAAVTDYAQGLSLLEEGNFRGAIKRFASALDKDPDFADAHFWIAQSRAWSGDSSSTFRHSARRAAQLDSDIGPNLRELVAPLVNLAEDQFPQACEEYERLLAADSANYVAWLGLGECHRRDRTVVTDPASPSGWRFRGSYYSAANAYRGALRLVPLLTPGVIRGLKRVLISDPSGLRGGVAAVPDTGSFLAWPERDDTLAFVPRPSAETSSSGPPPTHRVAIEANRGELLRVVRNWAEAYPRLFTAQAALAEALEKAGELDGPTVNVSALNVARRARSLARSVADSVAAAIIEVRILTKLGRFTESQELARSTLDDFANRTPALAGSLAPLAALTGRPVLTARLMGSAAAVAPAHPLDRLADVSTPVLVARETLLGYATVGVPVDSIAQWIGRVDSLVRIHVEPRVADAVLCAASDRALSLAFPVLRRVVEDEPCRQRSYLLQLQYLLARGDTTRLLELVDRLDLIRMDALPGEMAIEGTYQEAWVLAAVGDTARAIQRLDRSLSALRTLGMWLMSEPSQAAGLVRAMALRAELAAASGDRATARRWATPVIDLWGRGGPDVQPLVGRMGALRE